MPKYIFSLSNIISLMDFLSEVSTLYRVEPGLEFRLVASNKQAQMTGVGSKSLQGKLLKQFIPKDYYERYMLPMLKQVVHTKLARRYDHAPPFPGTVEVLDVLITPILENGECTHIWVISKHRQSEKNLEYLALHDELTEVPNRRFFLERANKSITRYEQNKIKFAIMLLDCDNFKEINDTFGHDIGDEFLRQVANRIKHCITENDFMARIGGDEFMILLEGLDNEVQIATQVANRIIHRLQEPWMIKGNRIYATSSIGIYVANQDRDMDTILSLADKALYEAKLGGRNRYALANA